MFKLTSMRCTLGTAMPLQSSFLGHELPPGVAGHTARDGSGSWPVVFPLPHTRSPSCASTARQPARQFSGGDEEIAAGFGFERLAGNPARHSQT